MVLARAAAEPPAPPAGAPRRVRLLPPDATAGWVPYAWLVYLGGFFIAPWVRRAGPVEWAVTVVGAAVFLAIYFRAYWERGARLVALVAAQAALGVGFSAVNDGASVFFIYAASFVARLERTRNAVGGIVLVTALAALTAAATRAPAYYWITVLVFPPLIGGVNLHFAGVGRANARLRLAQHEIERLAAVAERERIARDLHDVLGHTLSLVVLKSELASKLAERDPARAAREIRDVERVARAALAEVRETIRGYRATLDDEVARARALLAAAGVRAEFTIGLGAPDRARDAVLALVLRETVTNVARHAGATACRVTVEERGGVCTLAVEDDGRGGAAREGDGLRGMRERVEALGGSLAYDGSRGMRVVVTIPAARAERPAERPAEREIA
jgi:two-component system sensor histidine kinase DesK